MSLKQLLDNDPVSKFFENLVRPIQDATGFSLDITKSIATFGITFVFALAWHQFPAGKPRHLASFISGLISLLLNFGLYPSLYYSFVITVSYALIASGIGQQRPFLVFFQSLASLLAVALYYFKYYYDVWQMDITSPLMVAVQKVTSLAWNLYDGHKQAKAIADNGGKPLEKPVLVASHQRRMAITECPGFFEFLSYIYFPITQSYGPSTEFKIYNDCVTRTDPLLRCRWRLFFEQFTFGALSMVYFTHPTDLSFMATKEFRAHNLLWRATWVEMTMHWTRLKYYSAWCLTASAMCLCGAGFDGKSWENGLNIFPVRLHLSRRPRTFIANWNCGTQRFLKYYIYIRGPKSKKTGQVHPAMQYVTFIVSAIWHGWYLGYYIHFSILFVLNVIDRTYFKVFPIKNEHRDPLYGMYETQAELAELKKKEEAKKKKDGDEKEDKKAEDNGPDAISMSPAPPTPSVTTTSAPAPITEAVDETWLQVQINKLPSLWHPLKWVCGKDWYRAIPEAILNSYLFNYAALTFTALTGPRALMVNNAISWWGLKTAICMIAGSIIYAKFFRKRSRKPAPAAAATEKDA